MKPADMPVLLERLSTGIPPPSSEVPYVVEPFDVLALDDEELAPDSYALPTDEVPRAPTVDQPRAPTVDQPRAPTDEQSTPTDA